MEEHYKEESYKEEHYKEEYGQKEHGKESVMADNKIVLLCDDTVDGILTAIYRAWEIGTSKTQVKVEDGDTMALFCEYRTSATDIRLSSKVAGAIKRKISEEAYELVYQAALSDRKGKAQHIYKFLQKGFRIGRNVVDYRQDEDVQSVCEMSRFTWYEAHRYMGFVRFEEFADGILVSRINPRSNIIFLLAEHFSDRLRQENWLILDTERSLAAVHAAGAAPVLAEGISEDAVLAVCGISESEREFQNLWDCFYHTISIDERVNNRQQLLMMPKRYRRYMRAENR